MDNRVGVAIFGFGRMGRIHARALVDSNRAKILYIIDEFDDAVKKAITGPEWLLHLSHSTQVLKPADAEKALADPKVKGVVICIPPLMHESVIELACKYKKHSFCEKPLACTVEGTVKSYALAKAANVDLFCGFNRRFDPAFIKIQQQVVKGQIGRLQLITSINRDHPEAPVAYSVSNPVGIIVEGAIHYCDAISWVAGEYPTEVTCMVHTEKEAYKKLGEYEVTALMLKYPSGLIAYNDCCRYAPYGYDQRFEVVGSKGALVAENQRVDDLILRTEDGDLINPIHGACGDRYQKSYVNEMQHFLDILEGKAKCSVSGESVINAMKVAMATEEAIKTGKVVKITY